MAKLTHNLIIFNDCVKLIARRRDDIFSIICLYKSKQKQFRIMYRYLWIKKLLIFVVPYTIIHLYLERVLKTKKGQQKIRKRKNKR